MNTQNNLKTPIIVGILILFGIIGGTYYFSTQNKTTDLQPATSQVGEVLPSQTMRVTAKHSFLNGKHIIAGEVEVPNPCTSLSVVKSVTAGNPDAVMLAFVTTDESEMCAQVMASRRFKVEFNATENATISATWNGDDIILNLIPVDEGEDLNTFDIYLKG